MSPAKRGRPISPTPLGDGPLRYRSLIGWLLRSNRVHGENPAHVDGKAFARAFQGGGWKGDIHPTRVTRWEHGEWEVGYPVIRRYEELLEVPPNTILRAADAVHRGNAEVAGPPALTRPEAPRWRRLGDLVDRALGGDTMDGDGWDELTADLDAVRRIVPARDLRWARLCDRLVTELSIAEHDGWQSRNEAAVRLVGDPACTVAFIAACATNAGDVRNQMPAEALSMLEITPHPDASVNLLRQMATPVSESARRGAWWSAAQKSTRRHLSYRDREEFIHHARLLLVRGEGHPTCRAPAADVLRTLGAGSSALWRQLADEGLRSVLRDGRIAEPETMNPHLDRMTGEILDGMPGGVLTSDPVLRLNLEEGLYSSRVDVRVTALRRIYATPYRKHVAALLSRELGRRDVLTDVVVGDAVVFALSVLGTSAQRGTLERLALSGAVTGAVHGAAVWALAHCGGLSSPEFWAQLVRQHVGGRGDVIAGHTARGVVYALGVHRRDDQLRVLRESHTTPDPVRRAARWWLNTPGVILRSTARPGL